MRFLGLPVGLFILGAYLLKQCGESFRDYQKGIIYIRNRNDKKSCQSDSITKDGKDR
jgi:hypothetical protein